MLTIIALPVDAVADITASASDIFGRLVPDFVLGFGRVIGYANNYVLNPYSA